MRRRAFLGFFGGAAAWPLAARAETRALPLVGYVSGAFAESSARRLRTLRQGLGEAGFAEGKNVLIDYRWTENRVERVARFVTDLVQRGAGVIVTDGTEVTFAAKPVIGSTPALFLTGLDPVEAGLVQSLNRPGGNLTGVVMLNTRLTQKRAELLHEAVPGIAAIGFLGSAHSPNLPLHRAEMEAVSRARGLALHFFSMKADVDFEAAFRDLSRLRPAALVIQAEPWLDARADRIIALAARYKIPAIYQWREQVEAGGLISYGGRILDAYRQLGSMAGEILRGRHPAELPVQQLAKIEMVVNLKTARALGLAVPDALLLRADEVME